MHCGDLATENRATFIRCNHIVVYLPILSSPVSHSEGHARYAVLGHDFKTEDSVHFFPSPAGFTQLGKWAKRISMEFWIYN
jgi:hypothetical protein